MTTTATPTTPADLLTFSADVDLQAAADGDEKPIRASILAYSGGVMTVGGWGPVVVDLAGMQIPGKVPVLLDHDSKLSGILGHGRAEIRGGQLFVEGIISRSAEATPRVVGLHRDGVTFQASVGVIPDRGRAVRVKAGQTITANGRTHTAPAGGAWHIRAGSLREVTITALGADSTTAVDIAAAHNSKGDTMSTALNPEDIRAEERQRIQKIEAACKAGPGGWGNHQAKVDELKASAIDGEIELDTLQASLLEILRASRPAAPRGGGNYDAGPDVTQKQVEACLMLRAGYEQAALKEYGEQIVNQAGEIRANSLMDLGKMLLQANGETVPRGRDEMIRASFSTVSLPNAMGSAMNRVLIAAYRETPRTWQSFAFTRIVTDFRERTAIRPSFVGELEELGPTGEIKHGSLDEATFTYSCSTFARMLSVTRRHIKNDDTGFLDETMPAMGRSAMRKLNDLVWSTIMGGETNGFFTSGRNNLLTGGSSPLSLTSLATAVKNFRKQRDDQGNDLDLTPRTLCVSPDLEIAAREILDSVEVQAAEGDPTGNALKSIVNLEVESRLSNDDKFDNASTTQWFLFGAPADMPVIVAYVDSQMPTVEQSDVDFRHLGAQFRVYHDFGVGLGDWRAALKSDGA